MKRAPRWTTVQANTIELRTYCSKEFPTSCMKAACTQSSLSVRILSSSACLYLTLCTSTVSLLSREVYNHHTWVIGKQQFYNNLISWSEHNMCTCTNKQTQNIRVRESTSKEQIPKFFINGELFLLLSNIKILWCGQLKRKLTLFKLLSFLVVLVWVS